MCTICHGTKRIELLTSIADCRCVSEEPTPEYDVSVGPQGNTYWMVDGKHHRLDGPAILCADGTLIWMQNDLYHRTAGPAIEYADGSSRYYIEGRYLSHNEYIEAGGT